MHASTAPTSLSYIIHHPHIHPSACPLLLLLQLLLRRRERPPLLLHEGLDQVAQAPVWQQHRVDRLARLGGVGHAAGCRKRVCGCMDAMEGSVEHTYCSYIPTHPTNPRRTGLAALDVRLDGRALVREAVRGEGRVPHDPPQQRADELGGLVAGAGEDEGLLITQLLLLLPRLLLLLLVVVRISQ